MNLDLDELQLAKNFADILSKKNLYILGAGVSANYINPDSYLIDKVKNSAKQSGVPIGEGAELTEIDQYRLIIMGSKIPIVDARPNYAYAELLQQNLDIYDALAHKYPWRAALICTHNYSLDTYPSRCPEYSIFNIAHPSSVIVSMNHDSLASFFIKNKRIIPLHGEIPPDSKKYIKALLTFPINVDTTKYLPKDLYLTTKEFESELITSDNYKQLMYILENEKFDNIVIIGYSFFMRNAQYIYDRFTFENIYEYLKNVKCDCIIIDNNPFPIANLVDYYIKPGNIYSINWANFIYSYIISKKLNNAELNNNNFTHENLMQFLKLYTYNNELFSPDNPNEANADDIINSINNFKSKSHNIVFYKSEGKLISNLIKKFLH